jgi:hypothetical protein
VASGPITSDDFQDLWVSATDEGYSRPFLENPQSCFEAWGQMFAQFERLSTAIDVSTQAMFIMPWSGQSNPSAQGAQQATVTLTFTRTGLLDLPLVLDSNTFIDEVTNDAGPNGPVPVTTGRRYSLLQPVVFNPGESGPFSGTAVAERPGYGYNNPLGVTYTASGVAVPGAINTVDQPGKLLSNGQALYSPFPADTLACVNVPDTPVPQLVGQYLTFIGGSNMGAVKRVVAYGPPNVTTDLGGTLHFESMCAVEYHTSGFAPSLYQFIPGETVLIQNNPSAPVNPSATVGTATFVKETLTEPGPPLRVWTFTFVLKSGVLPAVDTSFPQTITGVTSGAFSPISAVLLNPALNPDTNAVWAMVDWGPNGFGLTVTNEACPTGGRLGMLDALGRERDLDRAPNEGDDSYAERVHQIADTISPNAVRRAGNRVLEPYGLAVCLREAGQPLLPGFFYDANDAYDYDFTLRPQLRNHVYFSYVDMRAYFRIGVPFVDWGEFGFAYDVGPNPAYDLTGTPYTTFYDGFPFLAATLYSTIHQAISEVIAGGVGFDLYLETLGCS